MFFLHLPSLSFFLPSLTQGKICSRILFISWLLYLISLLLLVSGALFHSFNFEKHSSIFISRCFLIKKFGKHWLKVTNLTKTTLVDANFSLKKKLFLMQIKMKKSKSD